MSHPALSPGSLTRTALALSAGGGYLVLAATGVLGAAFLAPDRAVSLALMGVAGTLVALAALMQGMTLRHARARAAMQGQLADFIAHDASPSFTTDADGAIGFQNRAAADRFGQRHPWGGAAGRKA